MSTEQIERRTCACGYYVWREDEQRWVGGMPDFPGGDVATLHYADEAGETRCSCGQDLTRGPAASYAAEMEAAVAEARKLLRDLRAIVDATVPDDAFRWLFLHEADEHSSILTLVRWARRAGKRIAIVDDAEGATE